MKAQLRHTVAAAALLLAPAAALISMPAQAAPRYVAPAPVLENLQIAADSGLSSGSQLQLTLNASPRGKATARIPGPNTVVVLKETSPGTYEGTYVVRRADRINPNQPVRVVLTSGNRSMTGNYSFPPNVVAGNAPPPVVAAPLQIERFVVLPIDRVEPGAELHFRLRGRPGANASVDIGGIASNIPLREVRPGQYEGFYTVRRQDNVAAAGAVTASLRVGPQVVTANLDRPLIQDAKAPQISNLMPRNGEAVPGGRTLISGDFEDQGGTGVDPRTVRIMVSGRDVTGDAEITRNHFSYRAALPAGRHTVDVTARDRVGNTTQKTWTFDVGQAMGSAPASLALQVLSHANNAYVNGPTLLHGRTTPGATVQVKVDAVPPLVGQRSGVAQRVLTQTVTADANGDFSVQFTPQLPIPGMRYEVSMQANHGPQNAEQRLTLFQRG